MRKENHNIDVDKEKNIESAVIFSTVRTPAGKYMRVLKDVPAYDLSAIVLNEVENAKLGLPKIKSAVIPAAGCNQLFPRLIGMARARWSLVSGEMINSQQVIEIGLIDRLVKENLLRKRDFWGNFASRKIRLKESVHFWKKDNLHSKENRRAKFPQD